MSDQDETDPGMEKLPDGSIIIGPASVRAQLKKQSQEALENAQKVVKGINKETEDPNAKAPGSEE